jgi:hypothetical protein
VRSPWLRQTSPARKPASAFGGRVALHARRLRASPCGRLAFATLRSVTAHPPRGSLAQTGLSFASQTAHEKKSGQVTASSLRELAAHAHPIAFVSPNTPNVAPICFVSADFSRFAYGVYLFFPLVWRAFYYSGLAAAARVKCTSLRSALASAARSAGGHSCPPKAGGVNGMEIWQQTQLEKRFARWNARRQLRGLPLRGSVAHRRAQSFLSAQPRQLPLLDPQRKEGD